MAKRLADIAGACLGLLLAAPVLLAAGLLIWLTMGRPVLFRQQRPGLYARSFTLLKLRTMTEARGLDGELLPDAKRLTHVGRWLRKLSIDELPQLWNVLRGEMSLVGPRPLLIEYLPRYTPEELRRHEVKPGITGWAQVNGRNEVPWADKFALDAWYVDHQSLWLDCVILLRSLVLCLSMQGISRPGHATAPEFRGLGKTPPRDGLALGGPPCEQS